MSQPPKAAVETPRTTYAAELSKFLGVGKKITPSFYRYFGGELAEHQKPPRAISYHDFTIKGWTKGELLPTLQAQAALKRLLRGEYAIAEEDLAQLSNLHDAALDWQATQKYQPTELSHALKLAAQRSGNSFGSLARKLAQKNDGWITEKKVLVKKIPVKPGTPIKKEELTHSPTGVHSICQGSVENHPSKFFTYAVEQICKPSFSLRAIHENTLRENADKVWEQAAVHNDLGGLIDAIRLRLGEPLKRFGKRIGDIEEGGKKSCSPAAVHSWIHNRRTPKLKTVKAIIHAALIADQHKNGLNTAVPLPWFTEEKRTTFLNIDREALGRAQKRHLTESDFVLPDPHKILPHQRVYMGRLLKAIDVDRPHPHPPPHLPSVRL